MSDPRGVNRPTWRDTLTGVLWISPWIVGFSVFILMPVIISAYLSFCTFDGLRQPLFTGADNLKTMAADEHFWKVLANTAIYAGISLPVGTLLAIGIAVLLNQQVPGRALWRALVFVPTLVPLVATAMIWMWMFNASHGLINGAIRLLNFLPFVSGVDGPNWLTSQHWTMPSMILLSFWAIGHPVVIYLAGLQDVPRSLYEAAHVDGASAAQRLWHVTLPMISPTIFFNVVMGIIYVWQVFAVPQIMLDRGGPGRNAYFYTMYLYDVAFRDLRFGYACLLSWVQLLIILTLTALAFRLSKNMVHYRGAAR